MPTEEMERHQVPDATLVTAREHLEEVVAELARHPRMAIDIESNGFYAYREKVCLLQISSPVEDYIIDPLAVRDFSALGPLVADPAIEKVFHAGEYDILCLKRDYGFSFCNVFDTMIASRLLGFKELGLAAAIERHFQVKLSKKLQRTDWGRRPLTPAHLQYAQLDTHFLMRLADLLKGLLAEKGRLEDAVEAFAALSEVVPAEKSFDPEGFWRLTGGRDLTGAQLAVLKELYLLRERHAQAANRAPFRVMPEELMIRLTIEQPGDHAALEKTRGMSPYLLRKYGGELLEAVARGREAPPIVEDLRKKKPRRDPREWRLFEDLRQWRKSRAQAENVDPVVILSTTELAEMARLAFLGEADPLSGLSALKRGRYAEDLLKVLKPRS